MDTIGTPFSHSTTTEPDSDELGIIQPQQPHELFTVGNTIVYNSTNIHSNNSIDDHITPAIVSQHLQKRACTESSAPLDTTPVAHTEWYNSRALDQWRSDAIEMNLNIHAITFLIESNYLHNCIFHNVYKTSTISIDNTIVGRQPSDPFSNCQQGEDMTVQQQIQDLPIPLKMDSPKLNQKQLTPLQYLQQRLLYLQEYKVLYKYSVHAFGNAIAISTLNGNISIQADAVPVDQSLADVINTLSNSIETIKSEANTMKRDVQVIQVTGDSSSIKTNATNPIDPGPVAVTADSVIRPSISYDEYEIEEIGPGRFSPSRFDESNSFYWSNYDDDIPSSTPYHTPSLSDFYPSYNYLEDVPNDYKSDNLNDNDEIAKQENNIAAATSRRSRVSLTTTRNNNQSNNQNISVLGSNEPENDLFDFNTSEYDHPPNQRIDPMEVSPLEITNNDIYNHFYINNHTSSDESVLLSITHSPDTYSQDIGIVMDRIDELFQMNGYTPESYQQPSRSPDLNGINPQINNADEEIDDADENVEEILFIHTNNAYKDITFVDTNLTFDTLQIGKGRQFISGASGYPPVQHVPTKIIAACQASYTCDNVVELDSSNYTSLPEFTTTQLCVIDAVPHTSSVLSLSSNKSNETRHALFADHFQAYKNVDKTKIREISTHSIRWWINVPILLDNGKVIYVEMMADTGANHPCCNSDWAFKHFRKYIDKVSKHDTIINTASDKLQPKFALYFLFPTPSGLLLKAKFYLLDNLPVNILADINMLYKFGYKFKQNDKPIKFVHNEQEEPNLHIKTFEDSHKIHDLNNVTILENINELCESEIKQVERPMANKANKITTPSVLCTTLQDFQFYKTHMDTYNQEYTVNYINDDLSVAQDVWAPAEYEQQNEKQLYLFGIKTNNNQQEKVKLRKQKLGATMTTPIQNLNNFDKYQTKEQFTSIAPINQSYEEKFENCFEVGNKLTSKQNKVFTKKEFIDSDTLHRQNSALQKYNQLLTINNVSNKRGVHQLIQGKYTYDQIYNAVVNNRPKPVSTFDLNYITQRNNKLGTSPFTRLTGKIARTNRGKIILNSRKIVRQPNKQHNINFIMMQESFRATKEELIAASLLNSNKVLKQTDLTYLKQVELMQPRFYGLYNKMVALRNEFKDIFATHTYSRRTMKVEPARLGIIDKFRHITCFRAQYPLSVQKRLWMIEYTKHNDNNHYWHKVTRTLHCIPYLMIPKRNKEGKVIRYRPAFDARVVNQYLELYPIHLPTMRDFDEIYSIKGLFTLMDLKNMFDCIPLHDDDKPWSAVPTPDGIRMMDHLAYGFKNCPYYAQNIMNKFAMHCGLTLAYIDDVVMKHHWHWDANQHINHIRKAFQYFRDKNMLLNPTKFFPFVTKCTSFGFERTLYGSSISDAYKTKIMALKKPTTKTELREFQGTLNYVSRYLYHGSMIQYWLNQLMTESPEKRGKLKWNKQAEIAYEQLKFLAANAPVLVNPTVGDEFMVKTDACITGIGAVLYQNQYNPKTKQKEWVMVDMYHKMMPKDLRKAHSTVHEAYIIIKALQHWQKYLIKQKFIIYTDNKPVSVIFTDNYEGLNQLTQSQLIRLRIALAPFTFEIKHVKGVENIIADALSRHTLKILQQMYPNATKHSLRMIDQHNKEWLLFGTAILSKDTRYKPKTQQDIDEINARAKETTKHVNIINQQLMNNNYNNYINLLANREQINANNRFTSQKPTRVPNKSTLIHNQMNNVYINLINNWKNQQPHCSHKILNQLINESNDAVITKDEYSNDEPMHSTMTEQFTNCINICQKMSLPTLSALADEQQETHDSLYTYAANVLFRKTRGRNGCKLKNKLKNTKTNQSLPVTTIENKSESNKSSQSKKNKNQSKKKQSKQSKKQINSKNANTKIKHSKNTIAHSNRKTKRIKMKLRSDTRKDATKHAKRTDYLNEDYDDLTNKRLIRQEFLYNLFGHRDKSIFDTSSFIERQKADTELTVVKSIIARINNENCKITRQNIDRYNYIKAKPKQELTKEQQDINNILYDYESIVASNPMLAIHIADGTLDIIDDLLVYKQIINKQIYHTKVVPGILKHKYMDYAHHNIHSHHPNWKQTYNNLKYDYWWPTMQMDIRRFVQRCLLCEFANGNLVNRAPLTQRQPVLPRESVFGDFIELQLAGKRMYILILVDYCTGWTMMIPTKTNDSYTVVDALIRKWIPLHGTFKYFDSDQGSGFIANVTKLLIQGLDTDLQFAEPGYHRGIGKVERTIRIIQDNFQRINLQWDEVITDCTNPDHVFNILRVIAPHIQAALNQRRPRISTFSPNMLMFGTQLKDLSNIDIVIKRMREIFCRNTTDKQIPKTKSKNKNKNENGTQNELFDSAQYRTNPLITTVTTTANEKQNGEQIEKSNEKDEQTGDNVVFTKQWYVNAQKRKQQQKPKQQDRILYKYEDYAYLEKLLTLLKSIYKVYSSDWHKYMYESKQQYNKKYNIDENKLARNNKIFAPGTRVLYFVGNKRIANQKWLRRFTGPWTIVKILSDSTVIIEDSQSKIQKRVTINRLKVFEQKEMNQYSTQFNDKEYDEYTTHLKNILFKVGTTDREIKQKTIGTQLDYHQTRSNNNNNKSHQNNVINKHNNRKYFEKYPNKMKIKRKLKTIKNKRKIKRYRK